MEIDKLITFWLPFTVAMVSLFVNIIQLINYHRVRNKISVWAKDAKGMVSSIVGIQKNIKNKNFSSLSDVGSNMETLSHFANSTFLSLEEELGRTKREITLVRRKKSVSKEPVIKNNGGNGNNNGNNNNGNNNNNNK